VFPNLLQNYCHQILSTVLQTCFDAQQNVNILYLLVGLLLYLMLELFTLEKLKAIFTELLVLRVKLINNNK